MISKIELSNIKGIGESTNNGTIEFDLYPNKPNIFVAPNGFGKSSFATAFNSMNNRRIDLADADHFENDSDNEPSISITFKDSAGRSIVKTANKTSNEISTIFDWFVINNKVFAKAKKTRIGGNVIASASMEVPPIILRTTIPQRRTFNYSIRDHKSRFGVNSKIIPNISALYTDKQFAVKLKECLVFLQRSAGVRVQERISGFKDRVNLQNGTKLTLLGWINTNERVFLENTNNLCDVANFLASLDLGFTDHVENYLAAFQLIDDFLSDAENFKSAVKRVEYELEKERYKKVFQDFNSSWRDFEPKEKQGSLIVELPKCMHISNGQRDVMCFIALLKQCEIKLSKNCSIVVIDEVFDYLDDANLIAVQYYVSKLIKTYKNSGRHLYPIIFTHLNPYFFKNFVFSKQKIFFLDKKEPVINPHFKKLLTKREETTIKDNVSRYHLHYEPTKIDIRHDFTTLGLKPTWGDSSIFTNYVDGELEKYSNRENSYDPFAVCCAIRKMIEKQVYNQIDSRTFKDEFVDTHTTPKKLDYADSKGVSIPETYYLLGIIYNDGLHYKNNDSAIAGKLENLTIRKMISEI